MIWLFVILTTFLPISPVGGLGYDGVKQIAQDSTDIMWFRMANDVFRYDGVQFVRYDASTKMPEVSHADFDVKPYKVSMIAHGFNPSIPVKCAEQDADGRVWIGTQRGLWIYTPQTQLWQVYTANDGSGLQSSSIWSLLRDKDDNMWVGTYSGGVYLCPRNGVSPFENYTAERPVSISVFAYDSVAENMYVGTQGDGVYLFNPASSQLKKVVNVANVNALLVHNRQLWIGTYLEGLQCMDIQSGKIDKYPTSDIIRMVEDAQNEGFFVIYQDIALKLSYVSYDGNISHYLLSDKADRWYDCLVMDDMLYLLTDRQIYVFSTQTRTLVDQYQSPSSSMRSMIAYNDMLYIGTLKDGLYAFDVNSGDFHKMTSWNYSVCSMVADKNGQLWMGTDDGLVRYVLDSDMSYVYTVSEGLQGHIFHQRSICCDSKGYVYVGGTLGFNRFHPQTIVTNTRAPKTILSDITINTQSVMKDSALMHHRDELKKGRLDLSAKEDFVGITISCTNYLYPEKNRYRFRINHKDWTELADQNRTISLVQLPAGKYVLEMQSANNDGLWGDSTSLTIQVHPPFYRSIWGWLIYAVLFGLLLWYVIYTTRRHYLQKQQLFEAEVYKKYCIATANAVPEEEKKKDFNKVNQYISEHITEHIDIEDLAREMGMSRRKLFDFVKKNTGKSIVEYIRHQRLTMAAKLMVEKNLNSKQVLGLVGFDSQSYFIKKFSEEYGKTPSEFMEQMKGKKDNDENKQ